MDKVGHAMGAYNATRWLTDLYKWSGVPKKKALLMGGIGGFMVLNSVEFFDSGSVR